MGGIDWNFRMNYYTSESEVTVLNVDPYNYGGFATFLGTYRIEEGWSPTAIVGSEMDSVGLSFDSVFVNEVFTGFDTSTVYQHVELGNENPDYRVSFNNSFRLGPIELSFLIDHKEGGSAINLANLIYDLGGTTGDYDLGLVDSSGVLVPSGPGSPNDYPIPDGALDLNGDSLYTGNGSERLTVLGGVTAPYIESTTYTVLRDVSITYTLPGSISDRLGLGYLKLGFSGRNLWLKTDYTGLSPEVSQFGNEAVGGSVDTNPFPLNKSMYLTLSIGL
jgi:hypothetical protein